jgi:putative Mg2+ transporter-C (MgtC) family protein
MPPMLPDQELLSRLILAAFLGGLIGFERERLSWVAGLRTHMLVCLGATLIMIVSQYAFHEVLHEGLIMLDPSRVSAQVVSGIGFLGAGTIIFLKNVVRGLTTAASLWAVAAVGLAVGGGLYLAAICTTALILLILAGIKPIEKRFIRKNQAHGLRFSAKSGLLSLNAIQEIMSQMNLQQESTRVQIEKSGDKEIFHLLFRTTSPTNFMTIMDQLRRLDGIENIELINESIPIS